MKRITSCLALLLAGTSSGGTAVLTFGEPVHDPSGWSVDVRWISDSPTLAGFQFEISIPELLEAGGGWCADNDWTLEHTQEMVLGFAWSFDAMVPPGTGVTLCTLQLGEEAGCDSFHHWRSSPRHDVGCRGFLSMRNVPEATGSMYAPSGRGSPRYDAKGSNPSRGFHP